MLLGCYPPGRGKRAACPRFSPRLKIAAFSPSISEHLCYNSSNPNQLRAAMPNTGNFSDREKRRAMDLLNIHDDFNAFCPLAGSAYPSPLAQNATLSEKSFSLSDKRTMSYIALTHINNLISSRLLPTPPFIRQQIPTPPVKTPITPIATKVANAIDMTTSTLPSENLCALSVSVVNSPSLEFGICPLSLKSATPGYLRGGKTDGIALR